MQKTRLLLPLLLVLGGCASDDLALAQLQVSELKQKVITLEATVQNLQESSKSRRVVRLPTGAPMRTVERAKNKAADSSEEGVYQNAVQLYRSGDMSAAISAFEQFNNTHPNSSRRPESLHYLGQAYYAQRRYSEATESLETVVYETSGEQVNAKSVELLKRLYTLSGNKVKLAELSDFVQRNAQ